MEAGRRSVDRMRRPAYSLASMKRTFAFLAAGVLVSSLAACTSPPPPPTLTVGTPLVKQEVAGTPAPQGRYLLEVPVTLANTAAGATVVSGWWYEYALATEGMLLLTPSTLSNLVEEPCASDTNVGPGGKFTCTLVFDLPCGDTAAAVAYEGAAVTALIPGARTVTVANCPVPPMAGAGGASPVGGSTSGTGGSATGPDAG